MQIRIYYEDTDAGGIVYHSNYLKYCERARSEYFFQKNSTPVIDGAHFVVRKMDCDFIKSAVFGDMIFVGTKILEMRRASFIIEHEIYKDKILLFKAKVTLVLARNGKPQKIDKNIKDMLQSLFAII